MGPEFEPKCVLEFLKSDGLKASRTALSSLLLPREMAPHPGTQEIFWVLSPKPHARRNPPNLDVAAASENVFNQPVISPMRVC